ncbi:MAG: hypothetical protein ACM3XO_27115, partial [Bacteroidota bacterium]
LLVCDEVGYVRLDHADANRFFQLINRRYTRFFDPNPIRGVTVLGRYTRSSENWGGSTAEWKQLQAAPDPYALRAAGYSYLYFGSEYWEQLSPQYQEALSAACVKKVDRVDGIRSEKDYRKDYRLLLDLRACTH